MLTLPTDMMYVFFKSSPTPKKSPSFNTLMVRYFLTTLSVLLPSLSPSVKSMGGSLSFVLPEVEVERMMVISLTTLHFPDWMKNTFSAGPSISPTISYNWMSSKYKMTNITGCVVGKQLQNTKGTQRLFSVKYLFWEANNCLNFLLLEDSEKFLDERSLHV